MTRHREQVIGELIGDERRSPLWMQRCGMEWLFRLLQDPAPMAHRYLVRGPRVFGLLRKAEISLRNGSPRLRLVPSDHKPVVIEEVARTESEFEDNAVSA